MRARPGPDPELPGPPVLVWWSAQPHERDGPRRLFVCIGRQRSVGVGGLFNFPGRAAKHDRIAAARGGRVGLYACILLPCQKLASGTVPVPVPVPRGDRDRRIKRPAKEISRRGTGTPFVEQQQTCDPARPVRGQRQSRRMYYEISIRWAWAS